MVVYHSWSYPRGALTSLLISFLITIHLLHAAADIPNNNLRKANCTGESYTPNSPFANNLATLLSSLTTKSSTINSATANITARNSSNSVYGLFMCQGNLSSSGCQSCISTAATAIHTQSCPAARQAIVWYDYCQLRYSDFNFFGIPDTAGFSMTNPNQKTSSDEPFIQVSDLVKTAPLQKPMFASKALINDSIYALAQCTADLSTDGCSKCLTTILADIKVCCTEQLGWRYLAYSCWVRYEATPFLNIGISPPGPPPTALPQDAPPTAPPTAPPQVAPPTAPPKVAPPQNGDRRKKNSNAEIVAIVAPILGAVLLGTAL